MDEWLDIYDERQRPTGRLRHPLAHGVAGQKQRAVNVQKDQLGHEKPPV